MVAAVSSDIGLDRDADAQLTARTSRRASRAPARPRRGLVVLPAVLVAIGMALTLAGWLFANPPGAAPDEHAHYTKAVAAGRGDLRGAPVPGKPPPNDV